MCPAPFECQVKFIALAAMTKHHEQKRSITSHCLCRLFPDLLQEVIVDVLVFDDGDRGDLMIVDNLLTKDYFPCRNCVPE